MRYSRQARRPRRRRKRRCQRLRQRRLLNPSATTISAAYARVVEPINTSVRALCCDELVGLLRSIAMVSDFDKYTLWCSVDPGDGGVQSQCGRPACSAFEAFWPKLRRQPPTWSSTARSAQQH